MFKSKLQEYCQSKAWRLPEYAVAREGLDHCPSFKAAVEVNGMSFTSPDSYRSIKEAHNSAAKLAFAHFTGCSNSAEASSSAQHPELPGTFPALSTDAANHVTKDNNMLKDMERIHKNQLQIYAQKRNLPLPVYSIERVGPPHASFFKANVTVDGKSYESEEFFRTVKEAETAAAKVALASLFPTGIQEDDPCIYKNLLQELLQKEHSCLPKYSVSHVGLAHMPVFVSAVEIQGEIFKGQEAKTKKQAEMNAAKVAYTALKERKHKQEDSPNLVGAHVEKSAKSSPANMPEIENSDSRDVKSNTMSTSDKLLERDQVEGCEVTPKPFIRTPGATTAAGIHSMTTPTASQATSSNKTSPGTNSNHENGSNNKKKKIMVRPKNSVGSPANVSVMHKDENWIAFTKDA